MRTQFEFELRYNTTIDIRMYAHFITNVDSIQINRQQEYNLLLDLMINIIYLAKRLNGNIAKDIPKEVEVSDADICITSTLFFNSKKGMNSFLEIVLSLLKQ